MAEVKKQKHTKFTANLLMAYMHTYVSGYAELIGSFGKGADESDNDIDVYLPIEKNDTIKEMMAKQLMAKEVEDTDWGGWFFHDTLFGNVDVFFSIEDFDH